MLKLEYIEKVWNNLEDSYRTYSEQHKVSKKEYIAMLIGYNPKSAGSTVLENYLSDEVATYNPIEFERYEKLKVTFNKIFDNLKAIGNQPVVDFSLLLNRNISSFSKNKYSIMMNRVGITPAEALKAGYLFDTVTISDGKAKSYVINNTADYKAIYYSEELTDFIYSVNKDSSDFEKTAYAASIYLAKANKLSAPLVFLDSKYFKVVGKNFIAGDIKHSCDIIHNGSQTIKLLSGDTCDLREEFVFFRMRINGKLCAIVGVL